MDHVGRDQQVLVDELGAQGVISDDTADLGGGVKYNLRAIGREPSGNGGLIEQIQLAARHGQHLGVLAGQPPHDRTPHHAAMARDKNALAFEFKR